MLSVAIDSFSYSKKTILEHINFTLKTGEHLSILGESGCGKSTLLHLIYGLLHLENGKISFKGKELLGPNHNLIPGEDFMKLVAQDLNVMPFTTVSENLGAHLSRLDEEKDRIRINELLEVVEMTEFKNTLVKNLSGGQKQRVALATALALEPEILLLDEPFSNIDTFMKNKLRRRVFGHLKEKNISCIMATHDSEEALSFSDQILMLKNGRMDLQGSPEYVYKNVTTEYQAGFFGEVTSLPKSLIFIQEDLSDKTDINSEIILFPHQLKVSEKETLLQVKVKNSFFKGNQYLIQGTWKDREVFFHHPNNLPRNDIYSLTYS